MDTEANDRPIFSVTNYTCRVHDTINLTFDTKRWLREPVKCFYIEGTLLDKSIALYIPADTFETTLHQWCYKQNVQADFPEHPVRVVQFGSITFDTTDSLYAVTLDCVPQNVHNFVSGFDGQFRLANSDLSAIASEFYLGGTQSSSCGTNILVDPDRLANAVQEFERDTILVHIDNIIESGDQYEMSWRDKTNVVFTVTFPNTISSAKELFRKQLNTSALFSNDTHVIDVLYKYPIDSNGKHVAVFEYPLTPTNFILGIVGGPNHQLHMEDDDFEFLLNKRIVNEDKYTSYLASITVGQN